MNHRVAIVIALVVLTTVGIICTRSNQDSVPVSNAADAQQLLQQTLNEFRAERSIDDLRNQHPPVYVADELWLSSFTLSDFTIDGPGEMHGTNVRFPVTLIGLNARGKPVTHRVNYLVTTTPELTIAKQDH